jgi:hypothetical protein
MLKHSNRLLRTNSNINEIIETNPLEVKKKKSSCNFSIFKFNKKSPKSNESLNTLLYNIKNHFLALNRELEHLVDSLSYNFIVERCINNSFIGKETVQEKLIYFYIKKNLEDLLKQEVDKYAEIYNIEKIIEYQTEELNEVKTKLKYIKDSNICLFCCESIRNVIFKPCMHMVSCNKCNKDISICLLCYEEIDEHILISYN